MKYKNNGYGQSKIFSGTKMNLQLFADEEGEGEDEAGEDSGEEGSGEESGKEKPPKKKPARTFTREELGVIVADEIRKEHEKWEKAQTKAQTEAERLKNMSDEEKKEYLDKQKDQEIESLKKQVARIGLSDEASKILGEHKIDATKDMLDFVVGEDAESTKANIDRFVKVVEGVVKKAEIDRNTGKTPYVVTGDGKKIEKDPSKMTYQELLQLKTENPQEYDKVMKGK